LQKHYESRGFTVLGFPANDFLWQERGSDADIQKFCSLKYDVTFPMFSKIHVKGGHIHPLYQWLTQDSGFPGNISWNFTKFVVAPDGHVIARFPPSTKPDAPQVIAAIEKAFAAR
jgi:glutathione peroxidase